MQRSTIRVGIVLAIGLLACGMLGCGSPNNTGEARWNITDLKLGEGASEAASPSQVFRGVEYLPPDKLEFAASHERERGVAANVYDRVAPATVLIKVESPGGVSIGSGVVIDPDGWLLTNYHVIADANADAKGGAGTVTVYRGRIENDFMHLVNEGLPATVYKTDKDRDLALVKISIPPGEKEKLPTIALANKSIKPGEECVLVGHPAAGTLWTTRSGEVVGLATFPDDLMLTMKPKAWPRKKTDSAAAETPPASSSPKWQVLLTNCNVNHGDSGGPLVNANGELIGLTVGMPSAEGAAGSSSVLSYHVHVNEVKSFLQERPKEPAVETPDPWPAGQFSRIIDADGDGIDDTLEFSKTDGGIVSGLLLDLNQRTAAKLKVKHVKAADVAPNHDWQFQFALSLKPTLRAFYDTAGSGQIDLILTAKPGESLASDALRLENGKWTAFKPSGQRLLDSALFKNAAQKERFVKIMNRLNDSPGGK